ncbi:hypothetical protein COB64_00140 [Candidatus Wolfebacteria bacterium]|nr:MAG: hypothetical protein COB64_00140 [Candidatus Wolfebacteria bacterium]
MRAIITLFIGIGLMWTSLVIGQNDTTHNDRITIESDVPYIEVCQPIPQSFWEEASDNELILMIEKDDPEAERAFGKFVMRCMYLCSKVGGSRDHYLKRGPRLMKTSYGERFLDLLIEVTPDFRDYVLSYQISRDVLLPIARNVEEKADTIVSHIVSINEARGKIDSWNRKELRSIIKEKSFSNFHQRVFDLLVEKGNNSDLEWLVKFFPDSSKFHQRAFEMRMERPIASSGVAYFINHYPQHAGSVWKKAQTDDVCILADDMKTVIRMRIGKRLSKDDSLLNDFYAIQRNCFYELEKSDNLKIPYLIMLLDSYQRVSPIITDEARKLLLIANFDSLSLEQLVDMVSTKELEKYPDIITKAYIASLDHDFSSLNTKLLLSSAAVSWYQNQAFQIKAHNTLNHKLLSKELSVDDLKARETYDEKYYYNAYSTYELTRFVAFLTSEEKMKEKDIIDGPKVNEIRGWSLKKARKMSRDKIMAYLDKRFNPAS